VSRWVSWCGDLCWYTRVAPIYSTTTLGGNGSTAMVAELYPGGVTTARRRRVRRDTHHAPVRFAAGSTTRDRLRLKTITRTTTNATPVPTSLAT
jgi:hypothetical protein